MKQTNTTPIQNTLKALDASSKKVPEELYAVIIEDRHIDTMVHLFTNSEKAISEAKRIANKYCRNANDYKEHDYEKDNGWLFYASYSCEDDSVRVTKVHVDKVI